MYVQTLEKIAHIRAIFGIERELERYLNRLKGKVIPNKTYNILDQIQNKETKMNIELNHSKSGTQTMP